MNVPIRNKKQYAIYLLKCCQVHIPLVLLVMQYLSFGEGNGNLLQYSFLENLKDRGI